MTLKRSRASRALERDMVEQSQTLIAKVAPVVAAHGLSDRVAGLLRAALHHLDLASQVFRHGEYEMMRLLRGRAPV